jgi:LysM repeat protein
LPLILLAIFCGGGYFAWSRWFASDNDVDQTNTTTEVAANTDNSYASSSHHTDTPVTQFPLPTSTHINTPVERDPLVYDNPQPTSNSNTTIDQPIKPVFIPLPEVPLESVPVAVTPKPVTPTVNKPSNATPVGIDTPDPVPGTPELSPATPIMGDNASIAQQIRQATSMLEKGQKLQARTQLSYLLFEQHSKMTFGQANQIRSLLRDLSNDMIFSKRVLEGDPVTAYHKVQTGDYLGPIARGYKLEFPLLERINQVKATRIWAGMNLKVIKGPFHAVVDKTDYLMDVYLNDDKGNKVFVATYPIGLGEQDSTPIGTWRVRPGSKVTNPSWADPRTGKVFQPDDPDNPIGEYWIGLQGTSENTRDKQGYGIHGTTEAQSIGQQMSMGCIRMRADDLVWVYYMMVDGDSTVTIRR